MAESRRMRTSETVQKKAKELRRPLTEAEQILWNLLRGRKLAGYKFRRQHPIGRFIVDFYCPWAKLIVELDGSSHDSFDQQEYDAIRTEHLELQGYTVIRFSNSAVTQELGTVARAILKTCNELTENS